MPKIQWERLSREKWSHLRDRAKERARSRSRICSLWRSEKPKIPMSLTAIGTRISGQAVRHRQVSQHVSGGGQAAYGKAL